MTIYNNYTDSLTHHSIIPLSFSNAIFIFSAGYSFLCAYGLLVLHTYMHTYLEIPCLIWILSTFVYPNKISFISTGLYQFVGLCIYHKLILAFALSGLVS